MSRLQVVASDDRGAVDLNSTMVTVIILAALFGAITLSVFKVIPWVQDVVTQSSLSAVAEAQKVHRIMGGSYVDEATLVASGLITQKDADRVDTRALNKPWDGRIRAGVPAGDHFVVSMVSGTGKTFLMHDGGSSTPIEVPKTVPTMTSTWSPTIASHCREITLPLGDFTGTVSWGDGSTGDATSHSYSDTVGEVQIVVNGTFTTWGGESWEDASCLLSVDSWGETGTTNLEYSFSNADNLRHVSEIPSTTTNMRHAFSYIEKNFTLGNLDTANVTTMRSLFDTSIGFNSPLNLDTSSVENMGYMFYAAASFNQPLNLDTSNVTDMASMLRATTAFNQPVEFDTTNVVNMSGMFWNAKSFDHPVKFKTSKVEKMSSMFYLAEAFNQPVIFDTSRVKTMNAMFAQTKAFNKPINFDTPNLETTASMFSRATAFNQPIVLNLSNVLDMTNMFYGASMFNQDLSSWSAPKVTSEQRVDFAAFTAAWVKPKPNWSN